MFARLFTLLTIGFTLMTLHAGEPAAGPLDFTVKSIDGNDVNLATAYKGKVVLIVNVASKCGFTKQYKQLEELHEKYASQGLAILGFPANNFGHQEPGTDAEIKTFCTTKFDVKFDMFSKVSVKGDDKCPLYQYLTSKETNPTFGGEVGWNFTKFLIDRQGKVVKRFESRVSPDAPEMVEVIEAELGKGAE